MLVFFYSYSSLFILNLLFCLFILKSIFAICCLLSLFFSPWPILPYFHSITLLSSGFLTPNVSIFQALTSCPIYSHAQFKVLVLTFKVHNGHGPTLQNFLLPNKPAHKFVRGSSVFSVKSIFSFWRTCLLHV